MKVSLTQASSRRCSRAMRGSGESEGRLGKALVEEVEDGGGVVDAAALDLDDREEARLGAEAPVVLEARGLDELEGELLQAQARA